MATINRLKNEISVFNREQAKYAAKHYGKYVLIYEGSQRGFYETGGEAYRVAKKEGFKSGAFLIRQCLRPGEEKTVVFHSRIL